MKQEGRLKGCWVCSQGKRLFWQCQNCGFIIEGEQVMKECPACQSLDTDRPP